MCPGCSRAAFPIHPSPAQGSHLTSSSSRRLKNPPQLSHRSHLLLLLFFVFPAVPIPRHPWDHSGGPQSDSRGVTEATKCHLPPRGFLTPHLQSSESEESPEFPKLPRLGLMILEVFPGLADGRGRSRRSGRVFFVSKSFQIKEQRHPLPCSTLLKQHNFMKKEQGPSRAG